MAGKELETIPRMVAAVSPGVGTYKGSSVAAMDYLNPCEINLYISVEPPH